MRMLLLTTVLVMVGCAGASYDSMYESEADHGVANEMSPASANTAAEDPSGESGDALPNAEAIQRRIIYTGHMDFVVEDFDPVPAAVKELATQFDARVDKSHIRGTPGRPRSGSWTIRVPVAQYEDLMEAARELGELRSERSDAKDVTAEYVDMESRLRNKQQEEDRLLKLLEDATGNLDEILKVERELSRVRGEIERMQGQLRQLKGKTTMSTLELSIDEIKNYVPESPDGPTYLTRVRRAFEGSIAALVSAAQAVSIACVAAAPWLGVLLVLAVLLTVVIRIALRRRRR